MKNTTATHLLRERQAEVRPRSLKTFINLLGERLAGVGESRPQKKTVADVLEQETASIITDWFLRAQAERKIVVITLSPSDRYAHLPCLLQELVHRLRSPLSKGEHALQSAAAAEHGMIRREQGYSAAMLVEESRILQVTLFQTLQNNLHDLDFNLLLTDVVAIADEVDSQLAQAIANYTYESVIDGRSVEEP